MEKYRKLIEVLENYGELGESVAQNPFLMMDLAELIEANKAECLDRQSGGRGGE